METIAEIHKGDDYNPCTEELIFYWFWHMFCEKMMLSFTLDSANPSSFWEEAVIAGQNGAVPRQNRSAQEEFDEVNNLLHYIYINLLR